MTNDLPSLPVAIIGAGPVGLAAAAHLAERGFAPLVLEAGDAIAAHLASFRHVRLFSPWRYNVDAAARRLLESTGWRMPPADALPTAGDMIDAYLRPLAQTPPLRQALRFAHRVVAISKDGFDKMKSEGREQAPFLVRCETPEGVRDLRAWAVIDASGTWGNPNPLGANGLPAAGERAAAAQIAHGMPDVLGAARPRYAGKHVLVAGAGHSAAGTLLALVTLADEVPGTRISWLVRGRNFERIFGGGENDGLPARGALGARLRALVEARRLAIHAGFRAQAVDREGVRLTVRGIDTAGTTRSIAGVDEIIVCAGARPDLAIASELRVRLDPWVESAEPLAPLIDPNVHSCGSVRPHGHRELEHPDKRYYAVGAKSYGRAPNFLLATGYEQVRSVVAALAGDIAAADDVRLELPETGVCSTQFDEASAGCCGGPPVETADACCVLDERARAAGGDGCKTSGCAPKPVPVPVEASSACCR